MLRTAGRALAGVCLVCLAARLAHAAPPAPSSGALPRGSLSANVSYRSAEHIYLAAGADQGVQVGQRLQVFRGATQIGVIEVVFVARHSATCSIVGEDIAIEAGDIARAGAERSPPRPQSVAEHSADEQVPGRRAAPSWEARQRLSGSFAIGWETFAASGGDDHRYGRLAFRGSLRLRNVGNTPYTVRLEGSSRRISREGYGLSVAGVETRNRLYEMSVQYDPPDGRFGFSAGRLATGPFTGNSNLDGIVGEVRFTRSLGIGAFVGAIPAGRDMGFGAERTKYGAFARLHPGAGGDGSRLELLIAGAREQDRAGHRDVAYVETTYRADRRFSLLQRAEIDLGRPSFDGSQGTVALAALSVSGFMELSARSRLSVSFNRWDRSPRIFDDDGLPLTINQKARTGAGAALYFSGPFNTSMSARGGARWQEGGVAPVYFAGFGLFGRAAAGVSLGGSLQVFTGDLQSGATASFNLGKRWGRVGLSGSYNRLFPFGTAPLSASGRWIRLGGEVDITRRVFLEAGGEFGSGSARNGRRLFTGLGYRF